VITVFCSLFI